jgi:hypothetical protein
MNVRRAKRIILGTLFSIWLGVALIGLGLVRSQHVPLFPPGHVVTPQTYAPPSNK